MKIRIFLLFGMFQAKALGKVLFEQVCRQLNLLEADYFGLEYLESSTGTKYWLDLEKALNRQVGFSLVDPMLKFCVKFYAPDPAQLEEEYTRYLFCLQVKRDLATGSLQCNDNTAALMASYIVQGRKNKQINNSKVSLIERKLILLQHLVAITHMKIILITLTCHLIDLCHNKTIQCSAELWKTTRNTGKEINMT